MWCQVYLGANTKSPALTLRGSGSTLEEPGHLALGYVPTLGILVVMVVVLVTRGLAYGNYPELVALGDDLTPGRIAVAGLDLAEPAGKVLCVQYRNSGLGCHLFLSKWGLAGFCFAKTSFFRTVGRRDGAVGFVLQFPTFYGPPLPWIPAT